jgi:bifunctional non-homologous end joining protein LigD
MALETYNKKRDFKKTPEPPGKKSRTQTGFSFVIQKHAARRLHYDFRLELDGVLLSWAVPKGPSLDPKEKRLAVHVEDHPIEYGKFEGIIPQKQYGAGAVILWDRGTWAAKGDPRQSYEQGRMKFDLCGEKLRGGWTLVRMAGREERGRENWLLIKERDDEAVPGDGEGIVEREPASVASGYTIEQIAASPPRAWTGGKARKLKSAASEGLESELPEMMKPQLATLVKEAPHGDAWLHEIKYDGYRILCRIDDGEVQLVSRNGLDWTSRFPSLADAARDLPVKNGWFDGEVVVQKPDGSTSFQALQNVLNEGSEADLAYFLFDVPFCNGRDLRDTPLVERKKLLEKLVPRKGPIRYSDHIEGRGEEVIEHACEHELEGIISKLRDSKYRSTRTRDWVKVKCARRQEFVIGGYTDPSGSRVGFGALLLGVQESGRLVYRGKVGTGFNSESLRNLKLKLEKIKRDKSAFANPPRERGIHWVEPRLVAEVAFTELTEDGSIRHGSFQGLREDKSAKEVVEEEPLDQTANETSSRTPSHRRKPASRKYAMLGSGFRRNDDDLPKIRLTHPDKVLYAEQGVTKRDLALYYASVAGWILPHLKKRPLTLVRCPNGPNAQCFYQKHMKETVPESIESVPIPESDGTTSQYMMVNSPDALIATVQMGVLELHPWGSTADNLERPDRMFFDLDPDLGLDFDKVIEAAHLLRAKLSDLGLASFVKTTGGKGLHVVVPLERRNSWDEVKSFSRAVSEAIVRESPRSYVATMSKAKRKEKIFIDYFRNGRGQTAVAAFSTRAKPGATVSVPIDWKELEPGLKADQWNVLNLAERLQGLAKDPWRDFFEVRQSITKKMQRALAAEQ